MINAINFLFDIECLLNCSFVILSAKRLNGLQDYTVDTVKVDEGVTKTKYADTHVSLLHMKNSFITTGAICDVGRVKDRLA